MKTIGSIAAASCRGLVPGVVLALGGCGVGYSEDPGGGGKFGVLCESFENGQHTSLDEHSPQGCGTLAGFPDNAHDGKLNTRVRGVSGKGCYHYYYVESKGDTVFPAGSKAGGFISRSGNVTDMNVIVGVTSATGLYYEVTRGAALTFQGTRGDTSADEYVYYEPDFDFTGVRVGFVIDELPRAANTSLYEVCAEGGLEQ